jgi:hypothetical protein
VKTSGRAPARPTNGLSGGTVPSSFSRSTLPAMTAIFPDIAQPEHPSDLSIILRERRLKGRFQRLDAPGFQASLKPTSMGSPLSLKPFLNCKP